MWSPWDFAASARTAQPTESDALLPPSVPALVPRGRSTLGCPENSLAVPSAFEGQVLRNLYPPEACTPSLHARLGARPL